MMVARAPMENGLILYLLPSDTDGGRSSKVEGAIRQNTLVLMR